jgi:hypothetical protein
MQRTTKEIFPFAFSRRSTQSRFQNTIFLAWRGVSRMRSRLLSRLRRTMHIWRGSLGSFFGHIRSQSSTELGNVYLGQEFLCSLDGSFELNPRTIARSEYIRLLSATQGWSDTVDLRIFLMGFDAGEEWTRHNAGILENQHPSETESWLVSLREGYGCVPARVYQQIRAFNGQTSAATPAAILGETRRD